DVLQARLRPHPVDQRSEEAIDEDHPRARVPEDEGQLLGRQPEVEWVDHTRPQEGGVVQLEELVPVEGHDREPVGSTDPQLRAQAAGQTQHPLHVFAVGGLERPVDGGHLVGRALGRREQLPVVHELLHVGEFPTLPQLMRTARRHRARRQCMGSNSPSNSFGAKGSLTVGGRDYLVHRLAPLTAAGRDVSRLPYSLKILLENLLRHEDGVTVTADDITALAGWDPHAEPDREIAFAPARILMQDFTGVPAVVDLAVMRDAMTTMGGNADKVNPLVPAELVIDHSIVADVYGVADAFARNAALEFARNQERYRFLRWGQTAFSNFRVVPPNTGICH